MPRKDFHARLCVRVVSGFEFELFDAQLFKESMKNTNQVTQSQSTVSNHTLDLMKLCQMGRIQGLITEHFINRKPFHRLKVFLLGQLIQHVGRNSGRVCS